MLSALIISPSTFFAIFTAKFDLPAAVGPESRIFLDWLCLINLA